MKKIFTLLFMLLMMSVSYAQTSTNVEMADTLRNSGKIYVVVAVIAVIFLGIATYLIYLDKRLSKLEKEQK
ncbi:MAG: CcmD family protein [Sphingobacteriales bacterium]|nr:CcmD family protein [Sphingobacteriales bacterium]